MKDLIILICLCGSFIFGLFCGSRCMKTEYVPIKCDHGKQWREFMHPNEYPVVRILEDGTVITHEKL